MCCNNISISRYDSPCGSLILGSYSGKLCLCDWDIPSRRERINKRLCRVLHTGIIEQNTDITTYAATLLDRYFRGCFELDRIDMLCIGTDFQCRIWDELKNIPAGKMVSYLQLARNLGHPEAVRAVANAVGANPLSIFIPCHRIVGSNGTIGGYAGGLQAKTYLLRHESVYIHKELR